MGTATDEARVGQCHRRTEARPERGRGSQRQQHQERETDFTDLPVGLPPHPDQQGERNYLQSESYRQVVDLALSKGPLRAGLTPETATDLLLTRCGDSTYAQRTTDRGWTHEQASTWLADATPRLLLP